MSVRSQLSNHPRVVATIFSIVIALAVAFVIHSVITSPAPSKINMFFTQDDGQSFFGGEGSKIYELEFAPTPAYRVSVYTADGGSHKFVGYIVRHNHDLVLAAQKARAKYNDVAALPQGNGPKVIEASIAAMNLENQAYSAVDVKRPGPSNPWVPIDSPQGHDVTNNIESPMGSGVIQELLP
jgi:hypothetical protein